MKQTRKISVTDKVFSIEDLQRIAALFEGQSSVAKKLGHRASIEYSIKYSIKFSNDTTYESESSDLFSDVSFTVAARPVEIQMSFSDYKLGRGIALSLSHGDSSYGNLAAVSANEQEWLSQNFLTLKEALDAVQPQDFWFRKHKTILLNLIAVGVGTLGLSVIHLVVDALLIKVDLHGAIKPLTPDSPWRQVISDANPLLYCLSWIWRWLAGFAFAVEIRRWFLSAWPSIEFNFGLPHLQTESIKRRRLAAVGTLIVIPIIANLIYDVFKFIFYKSD